MKATEKQVKVMVLGNPGIGKTRTIRRLVFEDAWTRDMVWDGDKLYHGAKKAEQARLCRDDYEYWLSYISCYTCFCDSDDGVWTLGIWDTGVGRTDKARNRRDRMALFPQTDVFLLCYSVQDVTSVDSLVNTWKWEMESVHGQTQHYAVPGAVYVVVGLKADEGRDSTAYAATIAKAGEVAAALNAAEHVVCSAVTGEGVPQLLRVLLALGKRQRALATHLYAEACKRQPTASELQQRTTRMQVQHPNRQWTYTDCDVSLCCTCYHVDGHVHKGSMIPHQVHLAKDMTSWRLKAHCTSDLITQALHFFGHHMALGRREIGDDGLPRGSYMWMRSYQLLQIVQQLGAGLLTLIPSGSHVGICARNSVAWVLSDYASIVAGMTVVPTHNIFNRDQMEHVAVLTELTAIVCSTDLLPRWKDIRATVGFPSIIIAIDCPITSVDSHPHGGDSITSVPDKVYALSHVLHRGATAPPAPTVAYASDRISCLELTSGSTGFPKAVIKTEHGMQCQIALQRAAYFVFGNSVEVCYEPLAHSSRVNMMRILRRGARVAVWEGEMGQAFFDELKLLEPTSFAGAPRVYDVLRAQFEEMVVLERQRALQDGTGEDPQHIEERVLTAFKGVFGSRLRVVVTGSAKTSPATLAFLRRLWPRVVDSYGITEVGTVAIDYVVQPGIDWKLIDVPEMGYTAQCQPPCGEICVKAEEFVGYWKDEDKTRQALTEDGYYRTNDIGCLEPDGTLRIVDRMKFVIKLSQGEFVAPAALEGTFRSSPLVYQIMVYGSVDHNRLIALLVPNMTVLMDWLHTHGITIDGCAKGEMPSLHHLNASAQVKAHVIATLNAIARESSAQAWEMIAAVHFVAPFVKEDGTLTPSSKICRHAIRKRYSEALERMFVECDGMGKTRSHAFRDLMVSVLGDKGDVERSKGWLESGGDSLSAVRLTTRLQAELGVQVPVGVLLDPKTSLREVEHLVAAAADSPQAAAVAAASVQDLRKSTDAATWTASATDPGRSSLRQSGVGVQHGGPQASMRTSLRASFAALQASHSVVAPVLAMAHLPDRISLRLPQPVASVVLLTGATGFVGAHLAVEWLRQCADAQVICLVRPSSRPVEEVLTYYGLWEAATGLGVEQRLHTMVGDLGKQRLGLSAEQWSYCVDHVDHIVHCGAHVNHLLAFDSLKDANVASVHTLLHLAVSGSTRNPKCVHFVSSVSACPGGDVLCNRLDEHSLAMLSGYGQCKWIGEQLMQQAYERGIHATVYRLGAISGATSGGAINADAYAHRIIRSVIQLGAFPNDCDGCFELVPVDWVARFIVSTAVCPSSRGLLFNLTNSSSAPLLSSIFQWIQSFGFPMESLSYVQWQSRLRATCLQEIQSNAAVTNALLPFSTTLPVSGLGTVPSHAFGLDAVSTLVQRLCQDRPVVDVVDLVGPLSDRLVDLLPFPLIDEVVVHEWLRFFQKHNLLPNV